MNQNIFQNKKNIVETIQILLYQEVPKIVEKIGLDNDDFFLNPLFLSYFNNKEHFQTNTLKELIQGYVDKEKIDIKYSANRNGISYIPEKGYFDKKGLYEEILKKGRFEIIKEVHPLQEKYFIEFSKGNIINNKPKHNTVWKNHYEELFKAIDIIKEHLPKFYEQLIFANSKIYLHDNSKILNFTSIETLGMLFFYVIEKNNIIYFIEELIHQGSHNYLYYVIHNRKEYFKIDVDNLVMRDFTGQKWDYRTIYGAFHGLFTVTQRVEYFDELLKKNIFSGREKHELLGRLVNQFSRFRTGLELLELDKIYTKKGIELYNYLDKKCEKKLTKYKKLKDIFLDTKGVDFRYKEFCEYNSYDDFLIKDKNNYFKF